MRGVGACRPDSRLRGTVPWLILEQAAHLADARASSRVHGSIAGDGPNHGAVTA